MPENADKPLVLVVDDEPANVGFLNQILNHEFRVRVALDGESALRLAQDEDRPDLILLDIIMPGIDGLEVCRRLKAQPATRNIPVIFVTVRDEEADELAGLNLGAVDYITKPYSNAVVLARARTQLRLKQARECLERQNQELREAASLREAMEQITRHDLKNPLQAILGNLDLLSRLGLNQDQAKRVEAARRACYRLLGLVNLSLDTYKIENGNYPFLPQEIDLVLVVNTILQEMRSLAGAHQVEFLVTLNGSPLGEKDVCLVQGEELLCFSMLANLIKNAVEASSSGQKVSISLEQAPGQVTAAIGNRGAVPAEIRDSFFEKYVTQGKAGGTGLGTYAAWLIARLHGGEVRMQTSEQEDLTTVSVALPWQGAAS